MIVESSPARFLRSAPTPTHDADDLVDFVLPPPQVMATSEPIGVHVLQQEIQQVPILFSNLCSMG